MFRVLALAGTLGAISMALVPTGLAEAADCSRELVFISGCPTVSSSTDGDSATLGATTRDGGTRGGGGPRSGGGGGDAGDAAPIVGIDRDGTERELNDNEVLNEDGEIVLVDENGGWCDPRCEFTVTDFNEPENAPTITISDIADFTPSSGINRMEPDGWVVVGLPANFYSTAGVHAVRGELLDMNAYVRFSPTAWHWSYGDGERLDSTTPGQSWNALDADEFSPTPTSHVFDEPGTYEIELVIDYSAQYSFNGEDWHAIAGTVSGNAPPVTAIAGSATTVLVEDECSRNPRGPGC
jgi:hypothetical protein